MRKIISLLLASVMLLGLLGCGQEVSGQVLQSDKPRDTSPSVSEADLNALVDGNNAFAFNLYQVLRLKESNLFYSLYSISAALAMTYAGARSETEQDMAEALHFTLSPERLHPAFNSLDLQLKQRGEGAKGKDDEGFRLNVVNAIWGQKDYEFLDEFLDILAQNYGAGLRILDFINETEPSRLTINEWVSDQTEERIKDLVPEGAINQLTRLVLTNAIYFNAAWQHQFDEDATIDGQFHLLTNSDITVPMMRQTESFGYMEGEDYQAVELLYDGHELSMVILLPEAGQFGPFEARLDTEFVKSIIDNLETQRVALTMPKFEYESSFGLKDALKTLGMAVAFTADADLSGMNGKRDLFIQDVLHKAFVSVDEAGTEAAAATAVIVGTTSMPPEPVVMTIDRPFIFFIRDIPTGSIIFVGRVLNPAK
ncbi:MAG: serpin family protein [Dehalococcoidales bacterium]|nr:serpin family protein [Dehalococcoidales bacterium]